MLLATMLLATMLLPSMLLGLMSAALMSAAVVLGPALGSRVWRARWGGSSLVLAAGLVLAVGCRVPRRVHEPRQYPPIKVDSAELYAVMVDARSSDTDPNTKQLPLPTDFEARVNGRLASLASGVGAPLGVVITLAAADETELIDARGEMTRVRVRFELEFKLKDGLVIRRAETQSTSDLPRDEATPEEVAFVLDATATDAFDRYFSEPANLTSLNRELARRR